MPKPPKVQFRDSEPLQDYYIDREGNKYSVAKLLDDTKDLPVFEAPLAALDLSDKIWAGSNMFVMAFHVRRCMRADLNVPILLDWEGGIADGRHRVIKALAQGKRTIKARRLPWKPTPCHTAEGES